MAMLLPPKRGSCLICATEHKSVLPHNQQSIFYQIRFRDQHGRNPTWHDACAHLPDPLREIALAKAKEVVEENGLEWVELPEGAEPIAEPYQTHEDRDKVRASPVNLTPISIAMDGSSVEFEVDIAGRSLEAIKSEVEKKFLDASVVADLWRIEGGLKQAHKEGIRRLKIRWERETSEITGEPIE